MTSIPALPCEMLMKNGRGYKNNLQHVIYFFIYFLHKLPLAHLPYKFIRTTIISWVITKFVRSWCTSTELSNCSMLCTTFMGM